MSGYALFSSAPTSSDLTSSAASTFLLKLLTQTHPWLQSCRRLPRPKGQHYQVVRVSLIITFTADKTYTLVLCLRQNVIKTGLHIYMLSMSHY